MLNGAGQPLRVLGYLLGGWAGLRALSLLSPAMWSMAMADGDTAPAYRAVRDSGGPPGVRTAVAPVPPGHGPVGRGRRDGALFRPVATPVSRRISGTAHLLAGGGIGLAGPPMAHGPIDRSRPPVAGEDARGGSAAIHALAPRAAGSSRWSGTAWMLWRPETGGSVVQAPLLGGSQAGARLDYRLLGGRAGQLNVYGRVSRAFTGPSSEEGALGLAWRPGRLPVSILAERRQRIGPGGRNGFALLAAAGFGPREVVPRLEAEGYAQAGIVGLPGSDGFADGKASLGYRLMPSAGRRSVTLGASLSGSVQPGASRLDVGPELRFRLPIGRAGMRLSTEWRTRIMGDARPAHGPAITLVVDF